MLVADSGIDENDFTFSVDDHIEEPTPDFVGVQATGRGIAHVVETLPPTGTGCDWIWGSIIQVEEGSGVLGVGLQEVPELHTAVPQEIWTLPGCEALVVL